MLKSMQLSLNYQNQTYKNKYNDPSFHGKFKGLILKKDLYINNIFISHFGKKKRNGAHKNNRKNVLTEIILNPKSVVLTKMKRQNEMIDCFDNLLNQEKAKKYLSNPYFSKYGEDYFPVIRKKVPFSNSLLRNNINTISTLGNSTIITKHNANLPII